MMDKLDFQFRNELSYCRREMGKVILWLKVNLVSKFKLKHFKLHNPSHLTCDVFSWRNWYASKVTSLVWAAKSTAIYFHSFHYFFFFLLNELFSVFKWKLEFFFFFFLYYIWKGILHKEKKNEYFQYLCFSSHLVSASPFSYFFSFFQHWNVIMYWK